MKAVRTGMVTLMGLVPPLVYPLKFGNSFSVFTDEQADKDRMVLNIIFENLEELIRQGVVSYPLEIVPVGKDRATIVDPRIPADWYKG